MTKKLLDRKNIAYTEQPLTPEAIDKFKSMGHMSAPVVEGRYETWSGFRPDYIEKESHHVRQV
jgi:L-alanine-DL-glutamate epimerase-like enolase superfamily enzyme